jgi:hypothetical protein
VEKFDMKLFGVQRRRYTAKLLQFLELMKVTFTCGGNARQRSSVRHTKEIHWFLKLML